MFGLSKSVQDFPGYVNHNYIGNIHNSHYLVSAIGGPISVYASESNQHITLETQKLSC